MIDCSWLLQIIFGEGLHVAIVSLWCWKMMCRLSLVTDCKWQLGVGLQLQVVCKFAQWIRGSCRQLRLQ